jgi:hypothetical protein
MIWLKRTSFAFGQKKCRRMNLEIMYICIWSYLRQFTVSNSRSPLSCFSTFFIIMQTHGATMTYKTWYFIRLCAMYVSAKRIPWIRSVRLSTIRPLSLAFFCKNGLLNLDQVISYMSYHCKANSKTYYNYSQTQQKKKL